MQTSPESLPRLSPDEYLAYEREQSGVQPAVRSRYAASGWLKSASLAAYPG